MTGRRTPFGRPRIGQVPKVSPICGRSGCGHPRLRHYTFPDGRMGCMANTVWPRVDPGSGLPVPWSHCDCPGFVPKSTVEER